MNHNHNNSMLIDRVIHQAFYDLACLESKTSILISDVFPNPDPRIAGMVRSLANRIKETP